MEALCNTCSSINFATLRGPTTEQVEELTSDGESPSRFARIAPGTNTDKVTLGPLSRIKNDSATCRLCRLFYSIIQRQGAVYSQAGTSKTLDDPNIHFRADPDLSYWGRITSIDRSTPTFFLKRLCLTAHLLDAFESSIAYFDNIVQACDVGTLEAGAELGILQAQRKSQKGMLFGGRKRPLTVNADLLRSWIDICRNEHGNTCSSITEGTGQNRLKRFRLVDAQQMSIAEFDDCNLDELNYLTLSYVWGDTQKSRLLKTNKDALLKPGSLNSLSLPLTITDSLNLVQSLGFRYIWVDILCIIQDDMDDQAYQMNEMASIYSSAFLTISAAAGANSDAGLPGLRSGTRSYEQEEVVVIPPSENEPGMSLINALKSSPREWDEWYTRGKEDADFSEWSHRAWTMQERALSRRSLMFTPEQVFWTCRRGYFCEESYFEVKNARLKHFYASVHNINVETLAVQGADPWKLYEMLVKDYMRREMSYRGDIFNAFQGVLAYMERSTRTKSHFGLPLTYFELALSWETLHGVHRRNALSTLPMLSLKIRIPFPSWSWMGWVGNGHCNVSEHRRESERPTVVCFVHDSSPLRLKHVAYPRSELFDEDEVADHVVTPEDVIAHLPHLTSSFLAHYPNEYLLFFWTQSAVFTIDAKKRESAPTSFAEYAGDSKFPLLNARGENVGTVCKTLVPAAFTDKSQSSEGFSFVPKSASTVPHIQPPQQQQQLQPTSGHQQTAEFISVAKRRIPDMPEEFSPPMILALQISRDEYGVASRVNLAEIDAKAWEEARPSKVLIALA